MRAFWIILVLLLLLVAALAAAGWVLGGRVAGLGGAPRVVTLRLSQPVVDYAVVPEIPFLEARPGPSLATIYRGLERARDDAAVRGVAVYLQSARLGLGKAQEIRRLLGDVSAAGKFVDCYLEAGGEGTNGTLAYYLASACDHVSLAPAAELNLLGLYADSLFLRGALDKLRIEPWFAAAGEYKSAAESYTRSDHSPAAREAVAQILDDLYEQIVTAIAAERALAPERVRELIDGAPYDAATAQSLGLVDALAYPDEFEERLDSLAGDDVRRVSVREYGRSPERTSGRRLAVVFAQGTIVRGSSGVDPWTQEVYLGADDLGRLLRSLRQDDAVLAVVLRVDSPGGSALASDLILREVELLAESKPVIVSMSDLAASGGYYIAARSAAIVAEAASLTGSIGVVAGKLVTRRFQQELLGLSHETLQRGANADFYSPLTAFSPQQHERFEALVDGVYQRFLNHVAEGRGMEREAVERVAAGRLWTGERALELGLVDEIGGLGRAVELAREAAGLEVDEKLPLAFYPKAPSLLDLLFGRDDPDLPDELAALLRAVSERPRGVLEMPFEMRGLSHPF